MHIAEGILSPPVLAAGAAAAAIGVGIGLRQMDDKSMVKAAVLSSTFFVASFIGVPFAGASVHLVLSGLAGILLGWAAFPAIAVALALHAFLGYGGITTLGVNTFVMAGPGLVCYCLFGRFIALSHGRLAFLIGAGAGALSIAMGASLLALVLITTGKEFQVVAATVLVAHIPVMVIDGIVTGSAVSFLRKVRPETFHAPPAAGVPAEEPVG